MNKFLATMATVSVIAIATPAAAQYSSGRQDPDRGSIHADANLSARMGQLHNRLQAGIQSGAISRREAMPLRRQLQDLTMLERRYAADGISGRELGDLQRRMAGLRQSIRAADGNDQARWDRYDREDGYGRYERDGEYDGSGRYDGRRGDGAGANLSARIGQLHNRLEAGIQSGSITRREAPPLRRQLRDLTMLERQYAADGIGGRERGDLQRRIVDLRQAIRFADGNDQARWDRYDREDEYGRYDRYGNTDGDRDGYDDRYGDRDDGRDDHDDGRWEDDRNEAAYPQQPARGGLGGIIDALLGGGGVGAGGGLRVGQRAPAGLYGLPYAERDRYRDGNGAYYRTDGRQIYQIDARSQTVVRIHPMSR